MNVFLLDKDLNVVVANPPTDNLVWTRSYYDYSSFSLQLNAADFTRQARFVTISEEPELMLIEKLEYSRDSGAAKVVLTGRSTEVFLDALQIYEATGDVYKYSGRTVEHACQNAWNHLVDSGFQHLYTPDFTAGPYPLGGDPGDGMGTVCKDALQLYEESCYGYLTDDRKIGLMIYRGNDQTQISTSPSAPQKYTFSLRHGNVLSQSYSEDWSAYKNACHWAFVKEEAAVKSGDWPSPLPDGERWWKYYDISQNKAVDENSSTSAYEEQVKILMRDYQVRQDISMDVRRDDYKTCWDLGSKCLFVIDDLGIESAARITEISETWKPEGLSLSITMGTKRITTNKRLARRIF